MGILALGGESALPPTAGCQASRLQAYGIGPRRGLEALAGKLGYPNLTVYDDWQSLIGTGNCDVISIATAPMLRSDPLLAALDQGCHVLVEKPISVGYRRPASWLRRRRRRTLSRRCFNWRYAPAYQTAQKAIRSGQIGAVRDLRTEGYFRTRSQTFSPWAARMDITNGTLGEGLSHDFDKARYLSGEEFLTVISRITPVTIKQDDDFFVDGGRSMHLAELSGSILAQFCFSITVGEDRFRGSSSAMRITPSPTPAPSSSGSDTTMIAGRVGDRQCRQSGAVHRADTTHLESPDRGLHRGGTQQRQPPREPPSLPTLTDGLRTEEIIDAARRSSNTRRWATVGG